MKHALIASLFLFSLTEALAAQSFGLCSGGKRVTCIVDGDTFWLDGVKIRIAGIDAPERTKPHCTSERELADKATTRLQELLSNSRLQMSAGKEDEDVYGRKLRFVTAGDKSVGDALISEGLARKWDGARRSWCN